MSDYGYQTTIKGIDFEQAKAKVTDALKNEGFGVLTEIDVKATLKKKIDVDFRPYVILGACNPQLAHQALSKDGEIGLLLPCNVVVQQGEDGIDVSIIKPRAMFQVVSGEDLEPIVAQADEKLKRVVESLA